MSYFTYMRRNTVKNTATRHHTMRHNATCTNPLYLVCMGVSHYLNACRRERDCVYQSESVCMCVLFHVCTFQFTYIGLYFKCTCLDCIYIYVSISSSHFTKVRLCITSVLLCLKYVGPYFIHRFHSIQHCIGLTLCI